LKLNFEFGIIILIVLQACERLLAYRIESKIKTKKVNDILNRLHVAVPAKRDTVVSHLKSYSSLCLNLFHLIARKPNLEKNYIYSNKFFHNFHSSESSFTCPWLRASGLAWRLLLRNTLWINLFLFFVFVLGNRVRH